MSGKAVTVHCDGPLSDIDREGEEFPYWVVWMEDSEGCDVGKSYRCGSYEKAIELTDKIAIDRKLEIVTQASPA